MIQLRYNSKDLVTPINSVISIDWVSNLFNDDDEFIGSRSYNLDLPFCDENNFALENAHMMENRSARKEIELLVSLFGLPWKHCIYSFKVGKAAYEGFLKIDSGVVRKQISEKLLPEVFINSAQNDVIVYREIILGVNPSQIHDAMKASVEFPGTHPFCFYPQYNEGLFADVSIDQIPDSTINKWTSTGFAWTATSSTTQFYSPSFYLKYVIKEVCAFLGFQAAGDLMADLNLDRCTIYNTGLLSHDQMFIDGKLHPAKHLPKIPLGDFFKRLRARFKLALHFDNDSKTVFFNYVSFLLDQKEAPADLSDKIYSNFEIGITQEALYEIAEEQDDKDDLYKNSAFIPSAFIGKGEASKKISTGIGTCFMKTLPSARLPAAKIIGNTYGLVGAGGQTNNSSGYTKNEFNFRLLHFHGLQNFNGTIYPYASSDGLAPDALTVLNPYSLWLLDGARGILNNFHLAFYQFWLKTEPVTFRSYLNAIDLCSISPLKQILIAGTQRVRVNALMHRVAFDIEANRRDIPAEITVYPIYNQSAIDQIEFTEFSAAPVVNAGSTYIKLIKNLTGEPDIQYVRYNDDPVVVYDSWEFIDVKCFADAACTIPKLVTNLRVFLREEYRGLNVFNYRNRFFYFDIMTGADGEDNIGNAWEGTSGYAHTEHYRRATLFKPKEYFTYKYYLEPSQTNDYIIVT